MYRLFILIKSTFINSIMKQNKRDKFAARLFKNKQKKQLKILNYNQFRTKMTLVCEIKGKKKWTAFIFSAIHLIHLFT